MRCAHSSSGVSTSSVTCKLCHEGFPSGTSLQSHLVRAHAGYLANRRAAKHVVQRHVSSSGKDRSMLHRRAVNGAHRSGLKQRRAVLLNGALKREKTDCITSGYNKVHNGRNLGPGSDRSKLQLDIDPTTATSPVDKHQGICSPDSTTDALGVMMSAITKEIEETGSEGGDSKDSTEEPKWFLGAPDGEMEEMNVSFEELQDDDEDDSVSRGTRDTEEDVDVISSAHGSPVCCGLSPEDQQLLQSELSSTTSSEITARSSEEHKPAVMQESEEEEDAPGEYHGKSSPEGSPEAESTISIDSTPLGSPQGPTFPTRVRGGSPGSLSSLATTEEAIDWSAPCTPTSSPPPPHQHTDCDPELLYGQCEDSCDNEAPTSEGVDDADICRRRRRPNSASPSPQCYSISSDSDSEDSEILVRARDKRRRKVPASRGFAQVVQDRGSVDSEPENARGLTVSPDKGNIDSPIKIVEDIAIDDPGTFYTC